MAGDVIFRLIMGHLVGDYLLQTNQMALNKKNSFYWASFHCFVWTLSVYVFLFPEINNSSVPVLFSLAAIWLSHMLLDYGWGSKHGIIDNWLGFVGSRTFAATEEFYRSDKPEIQKSFMVAYTAIVQTVADNAIHLLLLYFILKVIS